ncbi:17638_t:CDS:1, partial [Racocetra persica]
IFTTNSDPIVAIELPKLYTWDFKTEDYKLILNKNSQITNNYKGSIFVCYENTYEAVYKAKSANVKAPKIVTRRTPKRRN